MACCAKLAPRKFLCILSLRTGSFIVAIVLIIVTLVTLIILAVEASKAETYDVRDNLMRFALATILTEIGFTLMMMIVHILLLIGVKKKRASILICWVAVQGLWLVQKIFGLIILLLLFLKATSFIAWMFALIFGIIAIVILIYFLLTVYAYWLEIKEEQRGTTAT